MAGYHTFAFVLIFLGGGIGSVLRHTVNLTSATFGWNSAGGTLCVNVAGSLAMGMIAGWFTFGSDTTPMLRLFLTTGLLGGFTTFSAFSLDAVMLWNRGNIAGAGLYVVLSVAVAIAGVFAGMAVMRAALA